jgi:hypothetical protein
MEPTGCDNSASPDPQATGKTVPELREEFQADFNRATAAGADEDCLSPEEILSLQSGAELDPLALEHLARCRFCSALRQAIEVDPLRMNEFQEAVRRTPPVAQPARRYRPAPFDWRLPAAALTTIAAMAMVLFVPGTSRPAATQLMAKAATPNDSGQRPGSTPQIEISYNAIRRVVAPRGTQITVSDVAPQVATAVVLSKSELTTPMGASPEVLAKAERRADGIISAWLQSNQGSPPATIANFDVAGFEEAAAGLGQSGIVAYLTARKGFQVTLGENAVAWVPESALIAGLKMNKAILKTARSDRVLLRRTMGIGGPSVGELKLGDGSVITLTWTDSKYDPPIDILGVR